MRLAPSNPTLTDAVHHVCLFKKGGAHIKLGEPSEPRSNAITGGIYDNAGRKAALNGIGSLNQPILSLCFLVSGKINLVNVLKSQVLKMAIEDLSDQHGSQPCRRRRRAGGSLTEAHHFTFPAVPVLADPPQGLCAIPRPKGDEGGEARESTICKPTVRRAKAANLSETGTLAAAGYFLPVSLQTLKPTNLGVALLERRT